jgi:hypothetical protein
MRTPPALDAYTGDARCRNEFNLNQVLTWNENGTVQRPLGFIRMQFYTDGSSSMPWVGVFSYNAKYLNCKNKNELSINLE